MGLMRGRPLLTPAIFVVAALCVLRTPVVCADHPAERQLLNAWEIHDELKLAAGSETAVRKYFPTFLEYQDVVMFLDLKFGYYSSGRVRFAVDYQTYPIALAPFFGQMIAEQIFRMWQGMRRAGTLGPGERFTIAEFGAGNGLLAESILDYLDQKAEGNADQRWPEFAAQVRYVCYDRSPALSEAQRVRNARFGKRFEAREADATDPTAAISPGSLKGVILSNELPDAFSVHKVILSADGSAEVAFLAPSLPRRIWAGLRKDLTASLVEAVMQGDRNIRSMFFAGKQDQTYLTRPCSWHFSRRWWFSAKYDSVVHSLKFHEVYVPACAVPEFAKHFRRYASLYAAELAKDGRGVVTYINLGAEQLSIQGAGRTLKAGYVITLDYGSNWGESWRRTLILTFGPSVLHAWIRTMMQVPDWDEGQPADERDTSDPYSGPTLNDITTDVNFGLMAAAGGLAGLTAVFFGSSRHCGAAPQSPCLAYRGGRSTVTCWQTNSTTGQAVSRPTATTS